MSSFLQIPTKQNKDKNLADLSGILQATSLELSPRQQKSERDVVRPASTRSKNIDKSKRSFVRPKTTSIKAKNRFNKTHVKPHPAANINSSGSSIPKHLNNKIALQNISRPLITTTATSQDFDNKNLTTSVVSTAMRTEDLIQAKLANQKPLLVNSNNMSPEQLKNKHQIGLSIATAVTKSKELTSDGKKGYRFSKHLMDFRENIAKTAVSSKVNVKQKLSQNNDDYSVEQAGKPDNTQKGIMMKAFQRKTMRFSQNLIGGNIGGNIRGSVKSLDTYIKTNTRPQTALQSVNQKSQLMTRQASNISFDSENPLTKEQKKNGRRTSTNMSNYKKEVKLSPDQSQNVINEYTQRSQSTKLIKPNVTLMNSNCDSEILLKVKKANFTTMEKEENLSTNLSKLKHVLMQSEERPCAYFMRPPDSDASLFFKKYGTIRPSVRGKLPGLEGNNIADLDDISSMKRQTEVHPAQSLPPPRANTTIANKSTTSQIDLQSQPNKQDSELKNMNQAHAYNLKYRYDPAVADHHLQEFAQMAFNKEHWEERDNQNLIERVDTSIKQFQDRDTHGNIAHLKNLNATIKVIGQRQYGKVAIAELLGKKPYSREKNQYMYNKDGTKKPPQEIAIEKMRIEQAELLEKKKTEFQKEATTAEQKSKAGDFEDDKSKAKSKVSKTSQPPQQIQDESNGLENLGKQYDKFNEMKQYCNEYMSKFTLHGPNKIDEGLYNCDAQGKVEFMKDKHEAVIIDPSTLKESESLTLDYQLRKSTIVWINLIFLIF